MVRLSPKVGQVSRTRRLWCAHPAPARLSPSFRNAPDPSALSLRLRDFSLPLKDSPLADEFVFREDTL